MLACLPTKVCPPTALASNLVWLTVRLASPAPKISGVMLAIFSTKARPPKALLSNHVWLAVLRASAAPAKARSGVLPTLALRRLVWWLRRCRWAYRDARHMGLSQLGCCCWAASLEKAYVCDIRMHLYDTCM